jgi:hypothetical protein
MFWVGRLGLTRQRASIAATIERSRFHVQDWTIEKPAETVVPAAPLLRVTQRSASHNGGWIYGSAAISLLVPAAPKPDNLLDQISSST